MQQIQVLSFWNFLEFFFLIIFNLELIESAHVKPTDTEGHLYTVIIII